MPEFNEHIVDKVSSGIQKTWKEMPGIIGTEAVRFTKENFKLQGYRGDRFIRWKKRNDNLPHKILFKSGILEGAVMILSRSDTSVTFGVDGSIVPYAQIHNEGGEITIPVTARLRKWAWAMWYASGKTIDMYKGIAFTKKDKLTVKVPQRQFMPMQGQPIPAMMRVYLIQKVTEQLKNNIK
jgi:phage gpG-like protein